ncbi:MAG: GNAT family N-acetyltransferase [Pseudomonadota bacterium]
MPDFQLVWPAREYLPGYIAALERGWSADNIRGQAAALEALAAIHSDADAFLASCVDREARGRPITLPDGSQAPRLPGYMRWMWDGEFCGSINFRWQHGTSDLPPHVLGHIGYAVVPWKQRRGYATRALAIVLEEARSEGLDHVVLTCDESNTASRRLIEVNRGRLVERFTKPPEFGSRPSLKYRIELPTRDSSAVSGSADFRHQ